MLHLIFFFIQLQALQKYEELLIKINDEITTRLQNLMPEVCSLSDHFSCSFEKRLQIELNCQ